LTFSGPGRRLDSRGKGDLRLGELGLADAEFESFELIAFHAQQSAEKLIKRFSRRTGPTSKTSTTSIICSGW